LERRLTSLSSSKRLFCGEKTHEVGEILERKKKALTQNRLKRSSTILSYLFMHMFGNIFKGAINESA
jgi:hypothetical protein